MMHDIFLFLKRIFFISTSLLLTSFSWIVLFFFWNNKKWLDDFSLLSDFPREYIFFYGGIGIFFLLLFFEQLVEKSNSLIKDIPQKRNIFFSLFERIFSFFLFPILFLWQIFRYMFPWKSFLFLGTYPFKWKSFLLSIALFVYVIFCVAPLWVVGYGYVLWGIQNSIDLVEDNQFVSGTGSMFPTFPKGNGYDAASLSTQTVATISMMRYPSGFSYKGEQYFFRSLERGDIITFSNEKTREITQEKYGVPSGGFIKRIVALEGDQIELRDGILYLNGQPQKEPYIARARSTFGGEFLGECQKIIVPPNKLFVMGDNRKGSDDSRFHLGFVDKDDVDHVLPLEKQVNVYDALWHDPTHDLDISSRIPFDSEKYLESINARRATLGIQALKYQPLLEQSAFLRAKAMLESGDLSFEAEKSNYPMEQALSDVGYSNIIWGEFHTLGYYEYGEMIEHLLAFPKNESFFLDAQKEEIGIAVFQGELNGCPTQIIVQHVAGYIPPNYTKEVIESWEESLKNLKSIQPGWKNIDKDTLIYKENKKDINRINEVIALRILHIERIVKRMRANEWLTKEENNFLEQEETLQKEQEKLAETINTAVEEYNKKLKEDIERQRKAWEEHS